jgi:hypothetical protein
LISLPHRGSGRRLDRHLLEGFERHLALQQLRFEHVDDGLELELVDAGDQDLLLFFVELDVGLGVLEVEALNHFLHSLLDGIQHFGHGNFRYDVETVVGHWNQYIPAGSAQPFINIP